jgi:ankyrin repeat protein
MGRSGEPVKSPYITLFPVFILLVLISSCSTTPDKARTDLKKVDVAYDNNTFVDKAGEGDVEAVKLFLASGIDPNAMDKNGDPALIAASRSGKQEIIELLLLNGADIECRDGKYGGTPLLWAALNGHTGALDLLLLKGAETTAREKHNGMTALHAAAFKGHAAIVAELLNNGVNIEIRDKDRRTPLLWAARGGSVETVTLLLDRGANLEAAEGEYGQSALTAAALMGNTGAQTEKTDKDGKTPLMWAAQYGRVETVELLLARGAKVDAKDKKGRTAMWWTKKIRRYEAREKTREVLRKAGSVPEESK